MSKRRKNQSGSVEGLAEWSEDMARHTRDMAEVADTNQRRRTLEFRAKQHARVATVLRTIVAAAAELEPEIAP